MILNQLNKWGNNCNNLLESKKIQKLLENPLLKDMTVLIFSPNELIFDKRGQFCCKMKCSNYNTRCYCPPFSFKLLNSLKTKNLVITFAKTYDFSELTHFINKPEDNNENYIFKNRVFIRRWVQNDFYNKIKRIFLDWEVNSNDIFAGGFSLNKCNKCYSRKTIKNKDKNCIPMPSPEALGIDVSRTLEKFNYYITFGFLKKMSKVAMLFTTIPKLEKKYLMTRIDGNDKPHKKKKIINENLIDQLCNKFTFVEFKEVDVSQIISNIKKEYNWLKEWQKAILWKTKKKSKKQIQNEIHQFIFLNDNYFALDFNVKLIYKKEIDYDGIEFY